jgi:soluble lytic murein transglycosylase
LGDRAGAQGLVRGAWRNEAFSADLEEQVLETFKDLLTAADHHARMEMRLYVEEVDAGLRAANRAGSTALAISKAWVARFERPPMPRRCSMRYRRRRAATLVTFSRAPNCSGAPTGPPRPLN